MTARHAHRRQDGRIAAGLLGMLAVLFAVCALVTPAVPS
jgi:hypothetical protein